MSPLSSSFFRQIWGIFLFPNGKTNWNEFRRQTGSQLALFFLWGHTILRACLRFIADSTGTIITHVTSTEELAFLCRTCIILAYVSTSRQSRKSKASPDKRPFRMHAVLSMHILVIRRELDVTELMKNISFPISMELEKQSRSQEVSRSWVSIISRT